jgi:hypothetical protein
MLGETITEKELIPIALNYLTDSDKEVSLGVLGNLPKILSTVSKEKREEFVRVIVTIYRD